MNTPDDRMLAEVDAFAATRGLTRSAAIGVLLAAGLRGEQELTEIRADLAGRNIYDGTVFACIAPDARSIGVEAAKGFVTYYLRQARLLADGDAWTSEYWANDARIATYKEIAVRCGLGNEARDDLPDDELAREFLQLPELAPLLRRSGMQEFLHPRPDASAEETP